MHNTQSTVAQSRTGYKRTAAEARVERALLAAGYEVRPVVIMGVELQKVLQAMLDSDGRQRAASEGGR